MVTDEPEDNIIIILPTQEQNLQEEKDEFEIWLREPRRRTHLRSFLFLRRNQPATTQEVAKRLQGYYRRPTSSSDVYYVFKQLMGWGVITQLKVSDILNKPDKTEIEKKIISRFRTFLEKIPQNIHSRFIHTNYYYVNNYGQEFIEIASQMMGASIKKKDGDL